VDLANASPSSSEGYAEGMADATAEETVEDWAVVARLLITDGKISWCGAVDGNCEAVVGFFGCPRITRTFELPLLTIVKVCSKWKKLYGR